jgi:hypothetical protein
MTSGIVDTRSPSEQHAPPVAGSADHLSRRNILAGLATAPVVAAVPIDLAIAQINDPHPACFAEWEALVDWCNGPEPGARELEEFPQYHRTLELEDLIGATPTTTLAGASAQLRLMRYWCTPDSMPNETLNAALENALATVERLAGGQAHG